MRKYTCPKCGAPPEDISTLVTYIANLKEEDGDLVLDKVSDVVDVEYIQEPRYTCNVCGHEFNDFEE